MSTLVALLAPSNVLHAWCSVCPRRADGTYAWQVVPKGSRRPWWTWRLSSRLHRWTRAHRAAAGIRPLRCRLGLHRMTVPVSAFRARLLDACARCRKPA